MRHYLRSSGRYGPSPFLVGHYGGLGELAQGFCRISAVNGSTYVLSHSTSSTSEISSESRCYSVSLDGLDETINCDLLVSSIEPPDPRNAGITNAVARCVAIIDKPLVFVSQEEIDVPPDGSPQPTATTVDTALVIFPPSVLPGGSETTAAHVLVTGEGSMSAPKGNCTLRPCMHPSDFIHSDNSTQGFCTYRSPWMIPELHPRSRLNRTLKLL